MHAAAPQLPSKAKGGGRGEVQLCNYAIRNERSTFSDISIILGSAIDRVVDLDRIGPQEMNAVSKAKPGARSLLKVAR